MSNMQPLMDKIKYEFNDVNLLNKALTHSSYANERKTPIPSNERLEFLGDSVLGMVTANFLYNHHDGAEGELTKLRAALVCEKALHSYATELELGNWILLGKGERRTGGASRPSILSDAFEALVAAVYIDADKNGLQQATNFITPFLIKELKAILSVDEYDQKNYFRDFKTTLQEIVQQNPEEKLDYILVGEKGPDHNKMFIVQVRLNSNVIGSGNGRSKKEAEQQAAKQALSLMGYDDI